MFVSRTESIPEDSSCLEQSKRGDVLLAAGQTDTMQLRSDRPPPNLPKLITKNASTLLGEFQGRVCVDAMIFEMVPNVLGSKPMPSLGFRWPLSRLIYWDEEKVSQELGLPEVKPCLNQ